jgi:hypothetical protein
LILILASLAYAKGPGDKGKKGGPPGNNGTVKIDGVAFDDHQNNEPHPGCVFQIDFSGYEQGDLTATYSIALKPPTGNATLTNGTVEIGEDAAGGAGDLDGSVTLDLSDELEASGEDPHPIQGYHVKLTVHAEGSRGADVKHKVFWINCIEVEPTESPSVEPTETPTIEPSVLPTIQTNPKPKPRVLPRTLARTGWSPGLTVVGVMLVGLGLLLRRRSAVPSIQ